MIKKIKNSQIAENRAFKIETMNDYSHIIQLEFENYDGTTKDASFFVNALDGWFNHHFKGTDNQTRIANGGKYGRLEHLSAFFTNLYLQDKSIKSMQTFIYDVNDLTTPIWDEEKIIKSEPKQLI